MTIGSVDGLQGQEREVSEIVSIPYLLRFHLREPNLTDKLLNLGNHLYPRSLQSHWRSRVPE
jgi:hypothetical protein